MAFPTGWTSQKLVVPQAKSGSTDKTNFPVLIKDSALPSEVYAALQGGEIADSYLANDESLEAYFRFESGARTTDSSGNSNTLTAVNSPSYVASTHGDVVDLEDSSTQYLYANDSASLDITTDISIFVRVKPESITGIHTILIKGRQDNGNTTNYALGIDASGFIRFYYYNSSYHIWTASSHALSAGNEYAISVSFAFGTGSSIRVKVNGVTVTGSWTTGNGSAAGVSNSERLQIGTIRSTTTPVERFDGAIDEVALFSRILTDGEQINLARGGGADLRVTTDAAGTIEIPFDIVYIDPQNETSKIYALLPTLYGSSDSDLYVWYNNPDAAPYDPDDVYGSQNVWQNYMAVYPTDNLIDRTANGNNASSNTLVSTSASTMVGKGLEGDGSKYAVIPDHISLNYTQLTVQAIVDTDTTAEKGFVSKGLHGSSTMEFNLRMTSTGRFAFGIDNNGTWGPALDAVDSVTPSTGTRYLLHGRYDGTAAKLFKNGSLAATASGSITPTNSSGALYIGTFFDTSYLMDARISEIRLRAGGLSDDWIATEQTMFSEPETFVIAEVSNIKSVNSVLYSDIKSIDGVAIASVKSIDGVE